ncbi:MAG: hypothetical protein A4E19_11630 [Nitrospira sp. SG-bin1]|nr:MAG: hypothetical protein A4E19_10025 [Nitrospira sp. SG-bin1]OQW38032.1 MAG: hypothetical protein A4E19_11630 [Nitrospira sp. SG-bin1]
MRLFTIISIVAGLALPPPWVSLTEAQEKAAQPVASQPKPESVIRPLVYVPPRKGAPAPGLRRGGGTRGTNKSLPMISLLAPDHVGFTLHEQPVLFWFTPTNHNLSYEFTLIAENAEAPIIETKLPIPARAGVQQIRLADYKVKLSPGERYQWSVALVMDPEEPSANVVAKGAIERVNRDKLERPLPNDADKADAPRRYAEAGVWYDALMAISDLMQSSPADAELRQQRAVLLEQGGLGEVATSIQHMRTP